MLKKLSWMFLFLFGILAVLIGHFVLTENTILADAFEAFGYIGILAGIIELMRTIRKKKVEKITETEVTSKFHLMNWIRENWFKLIIIILLTTVVAIYSFDMWKKYHPYRTEKEKILDKIQEEIDRRCSSGEAPVADCLKY